MTSLTSLWRVELFGGLRVVRGEQIITRFRTQKAGALLAYLAYYPGQIHSREVLADLLWPECAPELGRNNLRVALASLRRQLEPPGFNLSDADGGGVMLANRRMLGLNPQTVETDAREFETLLKIALEPLSIKARHDKIDPQKALMRAVELYRGPLLAGYYEDWIALEEQRLEVLFFKALDTLVSWLEKAGETERALEYVQRGLRIDPNRGRTQLDFQRLYEQLDRTEQPANQSLRRGSAQIQDSADTDAANLAHPDSPLTRRPNLPIPLTRFFGREEEVGNLCRLVIDPAVRIVTLTGTGGSGKTRLSIEVARRVSEEGTGVVSFVSLDSLSDPRLILNAILDAIDVPRNPAATALQQLITALGAGPSLLVLDNFEQLLPAGASVIQTLLQQVAQFTILLTSRQKLDLSGEREWPVSPLPAPPAEIGDGLNAYAKEPDKTRPLDKTLPTASQNLQVVAAYSSVQLFLDRAQAIRPDFQLTRQNVVPVVRLMQRLEGLPLAIELIAARAGVLSPAQMLTHLEAVTVETAPTAVATANASSYLDLLQSEQKHWPERQRALRTTIAWSYGLLPPALREFLVRLWVLRGGFRLEAAQAICDEPEALHFLSQLRGASLVVTEESGLDDQLAEIRFRLLEPLREFAGEQLTADEKYSLQESHARYFLHLAQQAENAFNSPQQMSWLARVAASADNFRAALAWALEQRPELALALAGSLAPFWQVHNHLEEGRSWLKQALERHGQIPEKNSLQDAAMQILRIKALLGAGRLAFYVGDFPAAHIHLNETIELSRSQQDWYNLALALQTLGHMELNEGKTEAALTSVQEALELSRQIEDQALIAENLRLLGGIYIGQGDYNPALPILEECQAIIRILGQNLNLAHTLDLLAFVHIGLGDKAGARLAWEDSLAIARAVHDGYLIGKTLWGLGTLARAAGELSYASELLGEATRVALETDNKWMRPFMLEAVAYLAAEKNKPTDAAQILGASEALRAALGSPLLPIFLPDYEHYVARLHSALDAATFDTAWTTGQQMSFEQAAAVALSCCTH